MKRNDYDDFPDTVIIDSSTLYPLAKGAVQGRSQPHNLGWARVLFSSFSSSNFDQFFFKLYTFFSLNLALRVGKSPTWEGTGYATGAVQMLIIIIIIKLGGIA